jgi:hypothetical protein
MSRRPFMSQNATNDDGSRFASELTEPNACECHPQAPEVELNKLPNRLGDSPSASSTASCMRASLRPAAWADSEFVDDVS